MTHRLSLAFILIGVITLLVYITSVSNQEGDPQVLFVGACLFLFGLLLRRRAIRSRVREAQRFRLLRRDHTDEMEE